MHPRNPHLGKYNFLELVLASPELKQYLVSNKLGGDSIDFDDPASIKALNRAILIRYYGIKFWDIPPQFLCPPIPGRADYIQYLADLFPAGKHLKGLDVGVGANCIYPLIGYKSFGWHFVGSDIESEALKSAKTILQANDLEKVVELRLQPSRDKIFAGIIRPDEHFDFSLCNPPFHASLEEARAGADRKRSQLGLGDKGKLNFGGKCNELWCEGGGRVFIERMIEESSKMPSAVTWYTTLVSKETFLPFLQKKLKVVNCPKIKVIDMTQGQKKSRILAWSFRTPA